MRARGSSLTQILALSPARVTPHIILLFAFCRQERAAVAQAQPASPPLRRTKTLIPQCSHLSAQQRILTASDQPAQPDSPSNQRSVGVVWPGRGAAGHLWLPLFMTGKGPLFCRLVNVELSSN